MWGLSKQIRALQLESAAIAHALDEIQRQVKRFDERMVEAASKPALAGVVADNSIVLRMLTSIEELSGKFYQVWERERQVAREQRKNAAGKSVAKRETIASAAVEAAARLPARVASCASCMDQIDGSRLATPLDQLLHGREEHDALYKEWLRPA